MNQIQSYQVDYTINVEATQGVRQVENFAAAVSKLVDARKHLDPSIQNVNTMMKSLDKLFRTQKGRRKDFKFKMDIDITKAEKNLTKVKDLLNEVKTASKNLTINVNPVNRKNLRGDIVKALKTGSVKPANAINSQNVVDKQRQITRAIGKINSGLSSLEKGKTLTIQTTQAKQRLNEIHSLLQKIRKNTHMNLFFGSPGGLSNNAVIPYALNRQFPISDKAQAKLQEKLWRNQQLFQQRQAQRRQVEEEKAQRASSQNAVRSRVREEQQRRKREQDERRRNAAQVVRDTQQRLHMNNAAYSSRQRGAINRLQYSKAPSFRNMPFAYMFNAYMGYSLMRRELSEAVEYSNIMETAHSILKVADGDLATFETRFASMARYVRQIGIETKFTAIEVAGAVKYLSMAGMGIDAINNSIRPITNLALIGDNDISQIADLATNIMAGYNIKYSSMGTVADILSSSVSRSNVNILEMAESYKMAAGYLKIAGVDFSESAAAIGILGNMGIKGTMAGTTLRAMSARFAKPTKEAQKVLNRLNVKFTEYQDVNGVQVEKLRPLSDIFSELDSKGATLADTISIFGKIAGNGAMMLLQNHEKLRELTSQNRASQGISTELAKVKQDTTKGLWYQMTSMFSESFMQGFEILEPQIKGTLKDFISKFSTKEFTKGLASIGGVLLDLLSTLGSIATWFTKNFHWIEPLLFTGIVATKLFKLAGAITNLGVALGFLGKQSLANSGLQAIAGLTGVGGIAGFGRLGGLQGLSMADKRTLVTAMRASGITGKGAMTAALARGGVSSMLARVGTGGLFASQVATGNGLIGAGASLASLGAGAVAATAGVTALVGALGWVAYKTWKVKEAKDAVQEEINANHKYRYPSIEALYDSLEDAYKMAKATKSAVDAVTSGKTIEESSGQKIGAFTGNWWAALLGSMGGSPHYGGYYSRSAPAYSYGDARQDDAVAAIETIAKRDSQARVNSAFAEMGKYRNAYEVNAFMNNIQRMYGQSDDTLDPSLWTETNGKKIYKDGIGNLKESLAAKTWHYANYQNTHTVKDIRVAAQGYQRTISSQENALDAVRRAGLDVAELQRRGFFKNDKGIWVQKIKGKGSSDAEKGTELENRIAIHEDLKLVTTALRNSFGGSTEIAENILEKAGFTKGMYANEPEYNDPKPWEANGITRSRDGGPDDGRSGGNYSGTGKLSSATPKQVIVNITNLMSVETIDLMKTPEGQTAEIQNFKEQMAQVLIDVVHDFDASWNG
ncbi:phage tail tape measure protein [Dysgonomonas sp. GY75]|uniref:phage tail tape measure protein n=1 Tax=Dysgonomonas sp. GY75 TaxID=2780419 RepID=UPI0018841F5A|nr:phage tail tape measure protein [Dysgonomonas sp. GY75]MBF0648630.1 phage tail tape measure protein [Dysgonomonas sp. GY75]